MSRGLVPPFHRIAIINRGEPAMRLIHAVRELRRELGVDLRTLALYTDPDRNAMFAREADEAFPLGPASYVDDKGERRNSYLDYDLLRRVLTVSEADAAWAGWGLVAEQAEFVDLCSSLGVTFVGPSAEVMRRLGDKITSKLIAEDADVPVAPWSGGAVATVEEAKKHAARLGYPLMVKATAGGGGRGIRRVTSDAELAEAWPSAAAEALKAFGDGTLFLETLVGGARHIEVQIIGDEHGTVWPVGVRDCSIQRRNQKVLEEAPSPVLREEQDAEIKKAARRLGEAVGYSNAGTVEFLYADGRFWFMEVNARLQVEHPVTELTTGLDLVKLQLQVAAGMRLEGEPPAGRGHAIEVRLNAEDPENDWAPSPGKVRLFRPPTGPGVRIDTGVEEDDEIASEFDSMIAKIIVHGADRNEALARLDRALDETVLVIEGGASNKTFLRHLLSLPEVRTNELDVGWLDLAMTTQELPHVLAEVALLQAAVEAHEQELALEEAKFAAAAAAGRPESGPMRLFSAELNHRGRIYEVQVQQQGRRRFRARVDGRVVDFKVDRLGDAERRVTCRGRTHRVLYVQEPQAALIDVDGNVHRIESDPKGEIRATSPAVVVTIDVEAGDLVGAGERLAVVEAMKMETSLNAPFGGRVREVLVAPNTQVAPGTPLLILDRQEEGATVSMGERLDLEPYAVPEEELSHHGRCRRRLSVLKSYVLGYDVDVAEFEREVEREGLLCEDALDEEKMWRKEAQVLSAYIDIISLFRRRPARGDQEDHRHSARDWMFDYLRDPGARGEGLPSVFIDGLGRALAHYGIDDLEPTPELRRALLRIFTAHQRMESSSTPILALLEGWLESEQLSERAELHRELLERVVEETRRRYPAVHDIASEVHYEAFTRPFLEEVRDRTLREAEALLASLEVVPGGPERERLIEGLVESSQPMKTVLSRRFSAAAPLMRQTMLEIMTRRYYRIRSLHDMRSFSISGYDFVIAQYPHEGKTITVITSHAEYPDAAEVVAQLRSLVTDVPADHDIVCDLYVWRKGAPEEADAVRDELQEVLNGAHFDRNLRRVVVAISSAERGLGMGDVEHFTFRPGEGGYAEEQLFRGLHPMMGKRLEIWRLDSFDITRLPSSEDVYLFQGVARENPADERLFALAEVRDLTPVRDDSGRMVRLPEFERVFGEVLATLRHAQAQRSARDRLQWNRVLLYVWPAIDFEPDELGDLISRLSPATQGLGIEKVIVRTRDEADASTFGGPGEFEITNLEGTGVTLRIREVTDARLEPLTPYVQKVVRLRRRGLLYPYELIGMLTPDESTAVGFPQGSFFEHDLDGDVLVPVDRPPGENTANVVVGVICNHTPKYPEGMDRVAVVSDPSRGMGSLAEAECARIIAALDLAEKRGNPLEWYAISAGALISMDSGTENMDWIARVLRRLIEFTQAGGEVNVIVTGINVGAQPYWNAEATMLMHTKGILIMAPESAMVLTGKEALDYSGGVSAEDNRGIGGYERIMGPNGQAQYFASDIPDACRVLLRHYDHTYVAPGESFPRRASTSDPRTRDVTTYPHGGQFERVGGIFDDATNPGRKLPFEIRKVMEAVVDQDHQPLERWFGMQDAEVAVVWDAHLGGIPVEILGFESKPLPRFGFVPTDGPQQWTAGTLFPQSSRKVARAVNAASGNRPLVVLANLSGFDGSPESMRNWQLEYGAEIGRAVVNFEGPIVFCVVSRYHGGAFVVFSNALNDNMEVAALEGTRASVIGGAPAAAVVFAREVNRRTDEDPRMEVMRAEVDAAEGAEKARLRAQLAAIREDVRSEKLGEVAGEFDSVHSVHRALEVGSVHHIVDPNALRSYLIEAVERGLARYQEE